MDELFKPDIRTLWISLKPRCPPNLSVYNYVAAWSRVDKINQTAEESHEDATLQRWHWGGMGGTNLSIYSSAKWGWEHHSCCSFCLGYGQGRCWALVDYSGLNAALGICAGQAGMWNCEEKGPAWDLQHWFIWIIRFCFICADCCGVWGHANQLWPRRSYQCALKAWESFLQFPRQRKGQKKEKTIEILLNIYCEKL